MKHRPPILKSLLQDEFGTVDIAAYIALITLVAIGMIAGLTTLRDGIAQEYSDLGWALMSLDQSYEYTIPGENGPVTVTHGTPTPDGSPIGLTGTLVGMQFVDGGNESAAALNPVTETVTRPGHELTGLPAQPDGGAENMPLPNPNP